MVEPQVEFVCLRRIPVVSCDLVRRQNAAKLFKTLVFVPAGHCDYTVGSVSCSFFSSSSSTSSSSLHLINADRDFILAPLDGLASAVGDAFLKQ